MILLSGAEIVMPDRVLSPGTLVLDGGRIVEIKSGGSAAGPATNFAFQGHYIVPGFIDVHVHGVDGLDVLGGGAVVSDIARRLPRFGVTAFCPTTVACAPVALRAVLEQVRQARETPIPNASRVLPAHLESNFISQEYNGAQPLGCLRNPRLALANWKQVRTQDDREDEFDGADVLREIERGAPDIAIVTVAPEIDGGLDLVHWLTDRGIRVSLGHSGAKYDEAQAAIAAGATHATHLFNRMPQLNHRQPGLVGAILQAEEVAAEVICDGIHVHPALVRMAISAKRPARMIAITDGTAGAGLPRGARAQLGGQSITVGDAAAYLPDGTLAGSVITMNRAFEMLVTRVGVSPVDAATMCATTPARELGLVGHGIIAPGAVADLVVLDASFSVVQTYVAGRLAYTRAAAS